jgi:chemotaxis regulatin CheY-phosphate phosphatase CheZ
MAERAKDGTQPSPADAPRRSLAADYAAIEDALAATARGRWFLAEYARRNRSAETEMLLEAIAKLETAVLKPQRQTAPSGVFGELVAMSEAIARTRREIAQIKPPMQFDQQLVSATAELDHIVDATEKATSDILAATEEIQEVAWTLRERGTDIALCDKIDRRATDIYTACSFQDITGQRTDKVVRALRFIEQRINAMIEIWGVDDIAARVDDIASRMQSFASSALREQADLLHGPHARGLEQDDVDRMLTAREEAGAAQEKPSQRPEAPQERSAHFERPDPLTFAELEAVKRATLFG